MIINLQYNNKSRRDITITINDKYNNNKVTNIQSLNNIYYKIKQGVNCFKSQLHVRKINRGINNQGTWGMKVCTEFCFHSG